MIQLEGVFKQLGNFRLEDIDIELPEGYIMGLIGPNASGKTTLINLLLGLYRPDKGRISIFGKEYEQDERAIHEDIGYVLQEKLFEGHLSLQENADSYGKYYTKYQSKKFIALLQEFGLTPKKKYRELSKGEELKFQFAFALAHDPKLLILDEATSNVDTRTELLIQKTMDELMKGRTAFVIAHRLSTIENADVILVVDNGSIVEQGTHKELLAHNGLYAKIHYSQYPKGKEST